MAESADRDLSADHGGPTDGSAVSNTPGDGATSRRKALRTIGAGAGLAWAAPTVVAVGAPTPAAAQSAPCTCMLTYTFGEIISGGTEQRVFFTLTASCDGAVLANIFRGPDANSLNAWDQVSSPTVPSGPIATAIPCGEAGRIDVTITDPTTGAILCQTSTGFAVNDCGVGG